MQFKTITQTTEAVYKEKSSEFLAFAYPIGSEDDAAGHLAVLKKKYFDATHHCYAWKLNTGSEKFSDDGEPAGTAGKRILNAILHYDLTNVMIVVVRYYGGTKLGVGPLGVAYFSAAEQALAAATISDLTVAREVIFSFPPAYYGNVLSLLHKHNIRIAASSFDDEAKLTTYLPDEITNRTEPDFVNATAGSGAVIRSKETMLLPSKDFA